MAAAAGVVVVVDARYCAPEAMAFAVTKTISLTGYDFTVTDARGAAVMQVEAAAFSFLRLLLRRRVHRFYGRRRRDRADHTARHARGRAARAAHVYGED